MSYVIDKVGNLRKGFNYHSHDNYEIIIFTNGSATFNYEKSSYIVKKGDVLIIPSNVLHCITSDAPNYEYYYVSGINSPYINNLQTKIIRSIINEDAISLIKLIYLNRYSSIANYLQSLIDALILLISNNVDYVDDITTSINAIIKEITQNFENPEFDVTKLLNKSGYSEDYIRAIFKKITGKTPNKFLTDIRINHAKKLIANYKNSASLYAIAELCGYFDYPYFSRKFKAVTGISPQQYKELLNDN